MQRFCFDAATPEDTDRLGKVLANLLPETTTIALSGTLGAGKTRFVRAVAVALGIEPDSVTSPTFVLCHQYEGKRSIFHLDAYRVRDVDDFVELGVEEYFEGPGLTLIEWADRVAECLPEDRLEIHIEVTGRQSRHFEITPFGPRSTVVVRQLADAPT